jgi:TetR/AcrR family transcriptional regulator, cholesterol catabolism regulator
MEVVDMGNSNHYSGRLAVNRMSYPTHAPILNANPLLAFNNTETQETICPKFVSIENNPIFATAKMSTDIHIMHRVLELFFKYGIKSLTMDDVARELAISKKTLYLHVENKADLVLKTTQAYIDAENQELAEATLVSGNALDEMMHMVNYFTTHLRDFNASTYLELQRYYPESYALISAYREQVVLKSIILNLQTGKTEGLYRDDFNPEIIGRIYIYALDLLVSPQLFPPQKYHFITLYKEFVHYHLCGILSPKGLTLLAQSQLLKTIES